MLNRLVVVCVFSIMLLGMSCSVMAAEIRAAVVTGQYTAEISCDDDFQVEDEITGRTVTLAKGKYFLNASGNGLKINDEIFQHRLKISRLNDGAEPKINKKSYAGRLEASVQNGRLLLINILELEKYLCSTVADKTMVIWPDEAIKAQAIAARSYAVYKMRHNASEAYDISATDEELPYQGTEKENEAISRLVRATAGMVVTDADGSVIQAVSTSSSGGLTESAAGAWGKEIRYLQSVQDYDQDCPDYKWEYKLSPVLLETLLEQNGYTVGKLVSIKLSPLDKRGNDRTATGRVKSLVISGADGTVSISGLELMRILSLNSNFFDLVITTPLPDNLEVPIENYYGMEIGRKDIDIKVNGQDKPVWKDVYSSYHLFSGGKEEKVVFYGYGKGQGVGLSVWGAKGMADMNAANTYKKILQHYYTGTSVKKYKL